MVNKAQEAQAQYEAKYEAKTQYEVQLGEVFKEKGKQLGEVFKEKLMDGLVDGLVQGIEEVKSMMAVDTNNGTNTTNSWLDWHNKQSKSNPDLYPKVVGKFQQSMKEYGLEVKIQESGKFTLKKQVDTIDIGGGCSLLLVSDFHFKKFKEGIIEELNIEFYDTEPSAVLYDSNGIIAKYDVPIEPICVFSDNNIFNVKRHGWFDTTAKIVGETVIFGGKEWTINEIEGSNVVLCDENNNKILTKLYKVISKIVHQLSDEEMQAYVQESFKNFTDCRVW